MNLNKEITFLITVEEAAVLSEHTAFAEMDFCYELYQEYRKIESPAKDPLYDSLCVFACMYNAGRIQGIREERAKKKAARAKEVPLCNLPMMSDEMWNELANKKSPCDLAGYTRDK